MLRCFIEIVCMLLYRNCFCMLLSIWGSCYVDKGMCMYNCACEDSCYVGICVHGRILAVPECMILVSINDCQFIYLCNNFDCHKEKICRCQKINNIKIYFIVLTYFQIYFERFEQSLNLIICIKLYFHKNCT